MKQADGPQSSSGAESFSTRDSPSRRPGERIRRLLRAYTKSSDDDRSLLRDVYDANIQQLIDEQLNFEELARLTGVQGHDRLGLPTLAAYYKQVESYLNKIVGEYEEKRNLAAQSQALDASTFPHLWGFMKSNWKLNGCQLGFRIVSDQMDQVIAQIRAPLMKPLVLPNVEPSSETGSSPSP